MSQTGRDNLVFTLVENPSCAFLVPAMGETSQNCNNAANLVCTGTGTLALYKIMNNEPKS